MKNQLIKIDITTACSLLDADFKDTDFLIFENDSFTHVFTEPIIMGAFATCLCTGGDARINLELNDIQVKSGDLVVIRPEQILQIGKTSADFSGKFMIVSSGYVLELVQQYNKIRNLMLYFMTSPSIRLEDDSLKILESYYQLLKNRLDDMDNKYAKDICKNIIFALFYELCNITEKHSQAMSMNIFGKRELFNRFIKAVNSDFRKHRQVNHYASLLCVTPKYLSAAVKDTCGKTAGEWIDGMVIMEAKNMLKFSNMNIGEIASYLHFPNQSVFGKYFKRLTGLSPKSYRMTA